MARSVLVHDAPRPQSDGSALTALDAQRSERFEKHYDFVAPAGFVPYLQELKEILEVVEANCDGTVRDFAQAASNYIHENFQYVKGAKHVHSSVVDSLSLKAGVCQDFAHLLLGVVRMRGLPARYVSEYMVRGDSSGTDTKQEEVIGGQASHAWAEVLVPGMGWMAFDPTLGKPVGLRHIRVAYDRDYAMCPRCVAFTKGERANSCSNKVNSNNSVRRRRIRKCHRLKLALLLSRLHEVRSIGRNS